MEKQHLPDLETFITFAQRARGLSLGSYKRAFLARRLKLRMDSRGVKTLWDYTRILKGDPGEWKTLIDSLSINVSEFFRDHEVFDCFYHRYFVPLIEEKQAKNRKSVRLWSAGCSHGEEAYSLAILLNEAMREYDISQARVWATDVDKEALDAARRGRYKDSALKNVTDFLKERYFRQISNGVWEVNRALRKLVVFRRHNLITDRPMQYVDAIFFRNVRIYFNRQQGEAILRKFFEGLNRGGYLVIGKVETLPPSLIDLFLRTEGQYKIFQKPESEGR